MDIMIADLQINGRYQVYDITKGHYIYSFLDLTEQGDTPPDIAVLPVVGLRSVGDVLIIDTMTH